MPGVNTIFESEQTQQSSPSAPGKGFFVGATERGPTSEPQVFNSLTEFTKRAGNPVAGSFLGVAAEEFFAEGGQTLIIAGVHGSGAVQASAGLVGSGAVAAITVTANGPGIWGNSLESEVTAGEGTLFNIRILEKGSVVETYTNLKSRAEAVERSEERIQKAQGFAGGVPPIVILSLGAANENPKVQAAVKFTGGTEGSAIVNSQYISALKLFTEEYGIGQVAIPGITAQSVQEALLEHGEKNNRTTFVDFKPQESGESNAVYEANIEGARNQLKGVTGAKRSACFSSWARIPGKPPLTTVLCPWSAVQAGMLARNDAESVPARVNLASAGDHGIPRNVAALVTVFKRPERDKLNENGITPIRLMPNGEIETYGVKTLAPTTEPAWQQLTAARLFMYVAGEGTQILEKAVLKEIDSHGILLNKVKAELQSFMEKLAQQLFNNPAESVNVGPSVNTKETLAKNEIVAAVKVKPNKAAEVVTLRLAAQA